MSDHAIAIICAAALFVSAVAVALAGADKSPPSGFLVLVVALAAVSVIACWRLVVHLRELGTRRWARFGRVGAEGLIAGLALGGAMVFASPGEPSVSMGAIDLVVWFAVTGIVGAVGGMAIWALALGLRRLRG